MTQPQSLWTMAEMAAYLNASTAQAARITTTPGFPKPIILPSTGRGERQMKRWIPAHVEAWAESQVAVTS